MVFMVVRLMAVAVVAMLATAAPTVVETTSGPVQGVASTADGSLSWKGVPYAQPPVGQLRWAAPRPPTRSNATLVANKFGNACPQECHLPPGACQPTTEIAEDCLFLNVYAPAPAAPATHPTSPASAAVSATAVSATALPVMVWIHGGRFEQGSAGVGLYDGSELAKAGPCVVVSINYRLGVLGFYTDPDLAITGNFAIMDQQLALRWVQDNAAAFGGDPDRVTIFGQSAGGASILTHLLAPSSWPMFHQAIMQSAPVSLPVLSLKDAKDHYDVFVKDSSCHKAKKSKLLGCLRALNWEGVIEAQLSSQTKIFLNNPLSLFEPWSPVVDGTIVPGPFVELLNEGKIAKVPLLTGHVNEEARMFVYEAFTKPVSKAEADALVRLIWNGIDVAKRIFARYPWPEPAPKDYRDWFSVLGSDFVIDCPTRNVSNIYATHGLATYFYNFNHSWEVRGLWGPNMTFCEGHSCHGGELPFEFSSANKSGAKFVPDENELAATVTQLWSAFAAKGTPNGDGPASWPLHTPGNAAEYVLKTPTPAVMAHDRAEFCDFWDSLGYTFK